MREYIDIVEAAGSPRTMTLWHGGRNLESDYQEVRSHGKGRWEHGPGLYLTTHYETASRYAKGGGKLYRVTIRQGRDIDEVTISRDVAVDFVRRNIPRAKQREFIELIDRNMSRRNSDELPLDVMINLCLNLEALPNSKTDRLRQFLIDQGADYLMTRYGGRDETVVVVFNPKVIEKVEIVKASSVTDNFVADATFTSI